MVGCNGTAFGDHGFLEGAAFPFWRAMDRRWNRNAVSPVVFIIIIIIMPINQ